MNNVDVIVRNHGSLCRFHLETQAAIDFVNEKVEAPDYMWCGAKTLHVETRYAEAIADGMREEGLVVS